MNEQIELLKQGIEQGLVNQEDIQALNKAITAGYGYAGKPTDLTYGGVLQTESLDSTLKSITFDMKNLQFWPAVSVDKAFNLFEQYNRLISVGSEASPYIGEGGAGQEEDSTYVRDGQKIVFFGKKRKVSHQMMLVRTSVGDIVAEQAKEGTMSLLKDVEREMYWGHAHFMSPVTGLQSGSDADLPVNSIAMNGLLKQLRKGDSDVLFRSGDFEGYGELQSIESDLDGQVITQDDIEQRAVVALENFGQPNQLHAEPLVISAFVRQFYPQFRSAPGLANQTVGYDVSKITTTAGTVDLKPNLFLRPRTLVREKPASVGAPAAPTISAVVSAPVTGTTGLHPAAVQYWKVTQVSDFGESAPSGASAGVAITGGECAAITITGLSAAAKYVKVYRGASPATVKFVGNFATNGTTAALTIYEAAVKKPGLGECFLLDMNAQTMKVKQLAPLSKLNLAVVATSIEFMLLLYIALFVYAPRFNAFFSNVGK
jgi:hypothetical protein